MRAFLPLALLISSCTVLRAPAPADSSVAEVEAAVGRLFDAMRRADGAAAAALFHPEARLQSVSLQSGQPVLRANPASGFIEAIGAPRSEVWDERIWDLEVRVDGNLASAWMRYAFYLDDRFSHCGVNAIHLFRAPAGWQIIHIADTRRAEGCMEPE